MRHPSLSARQDAPFRMRCSPAESQKWHQCDGYEGLVSWMQTLCHPTLPFFCFVFVFLSVLLSCNGLFFRGADPCQHGPRSRWSIGISLRQAFSQVGCSVNDWQLSASLRQQHEPFLRRQSKRTQPDRMNVLLTVLSLLCAKGFSNLTKHCGSSQAPKLSIKVCRSFRFFPTEFYNV